MARSRDLGKLPFELKGGAVKTILSKATNDDYDFVFRNLEAADMPTGIDALNISTGKVTNTEFDYLDGATSNIQGQIDNIKGLKSGIATGTDTYSVSITGITSYADGDAYLVRFTNGNTTNCTLNVNALGAKALYRNNDGALIGGDILDGGEMLCVYNSTLDAFQTIGTAPNTLLAYVTNGEASTPITKGQPVYAAGGIGDRMKVKLAYNTGDATSAQTVGLVLSSSIAANQKGLIIIQGLLDGLNILPTSTFADGDPIYLGATAGSITNVKPYAPNHLVYLGVVTTASNGNAGRMYVRVQNGYELDELHNVQAQTPSTNDVLYYFGGKQWKTASISSVLGYTPGTVSSVAALTLGTSGTDLSSTVANGTTTPVITLNVPTASASNRGVLSSADWSTFNSKESALTFGTGLSRVGNTITNTITQYTDALARLAITDSVTGLDYNSTTGVWSTTSGYGIPTTASQTNWDNAYTNRITSLTTTGSSGSATLVSNTLNIPTYTLAGLGGFANPMTTAGDIIYGGASGVATRLAGSGTNGWVLTYDTATNAPKWAASSGGGGMAIGGSITSATAGSILFADTSGVLAQDNTNFFWNNSNKRLGIGTASPTTTLDVRGAFNFLNTGALTSTLQDIGTYTINSSGTTAVGFGMRLLFQGRVNTSDSQPFGYISPYIRYYSALPSSWGTGMNFGIYNNGGYVNVLNITGNLGGELTATNLTLSGGNFYASSNSLSHATQVIGGFNNSNNSAINYATTNGGSLFAAQGVFGLVTVSAGNTSIRLHNTNGVVFTAGNGASHIARAAIQIVSLTNTAGSETGDLALYTQSGGTAMSEKMRIFAAGNVGINTGSTNGGYKLDVNGTSRIQNVLTTTGRVHANSRKTSAYTLTTLDRIIFADLATGAFTITLPNHVAGTEYTIIKIDSTANLLTVNTTSGLINGSSTWTTLIQYRYITLVSDGTNWLKVSEGN